MIEEYVFRYYLCNLFLSRYSCIHWIRGRVDRRKAVLFSACLFSLQHIVLLFNGESIPNVLTNMVLSFVAGIAFACAMLNGTILSSVLLHVINNTVSIFLRGKNLPEWLCVSIEVYLLVYYVSLIAEWSVKQKKNSFVCCKQINASYLFRPESRRGERTQSWWAW